MKAPNKIDAYLRGEGFGYAKPYYLRHNLRRKLNESWLFSKDPEGLSLQAMVFYPEGEGGMSVSPAEIGFLYADGRVSGTPSRDWREAFWDPKAVDVLIAALAGHGAHYLAQLNDPKLMIAVYDFLMSDAGSGNTCPPEFPELARPWVLRKVTPNRLRGKAAYLALLGRFAEAKSLIAQISSNLLTPGDRKILADAEVGEVHVPPEAIAFLTETGAR